jgi:hypothetical protein
MHVHVATLIGACTRESHRPTQLSVLYDVHMHHTSVEYIIVIEIYIC